MFITKYDKTISQLRKNTTSERVKLNKTEVELIKKLTTITTETVIYGEGDNPSEHINHDYDITVRVNPFQYRPEIFDKNEGEFKAGRVLKVYGYEKSRKNSNEIISKALMKEVEKRNKLIDQQTATLINVQIKQLKESGELKGMKLKNVDLMKIAKFVMPSSGEGRVYVQSSIVKKLNKKVSKKEQKKQIKEANKKAQAVAEQIKQFKGRYKISQYQTGKNNMLEKMHEKEWPLYYIRQAEKFNRLQVTYFYHSPEFIKYNMMVLYYNNAFYRSVGVPLLESIIKEKDLFRMNKRKDNKENDNNLIDLDSIKENSYESTTNAMRSKKEKR